MLVKQSIAINQAFIKISGKIGKDVILDKPVEIWKSDKLTKHT